LYTHVIKFQLIFLNKENFTSVQHHSFIV